MSRLILQRFLVCMLTSAVLCSEILYNSSVDRVEEFCQHEVMKGRCRWKSEVMVMTMARWGRMKTGRCLSIHPNLLATNGHDPLFLGCSADVLTVMDKKCSGRTECDVRMIDPELDSVTPCYPDLTRYMEASYSCVKVVQETRSCTVAVTNEPQFISNNVSMTDGSAVHSSASSCGSISHPWRLESPLGQRINISLLDFGTNSLDQRQNSKNAECQQYGYIIDKSNKQNTSLCRSLIGDVPHLQRYSHVYVSSGNLVDIVLIQKDLARSTFGEKYNFLISVEAVGCTNMIPPDNAWLKRSNSDIVVGCYLSQQTWQLKCDGHEWKGLVGTCPDTYAGPVVNADEQVAKEDNNIQDKVIMVVIGSGAIILCLTVVCIGCFCLRQYKRNILFKSEECNYNGHKQLLTTAVDVTMMNSSNLQATVSNH